MKETEIEPLGYEELNVDDPQSQDRTIPIFRFGFTKDSEQNPTIEVSVIGVDWIQSLSYEHYESYRAAIPEMVKHVLDHHRTAVKAH